MYLLCFSKCLSLSAGPNLWVGLGRDHIKKQIKGVGEEDRGDWKPWRTLLFISPREALRTFSVEKISLEAGERMTAEI